MAGCSRTSGSIRSLYPGEGLPIVVPLLVGFRCALLAAAMSAVRGATLRSQRPPSDCYRLAAALRRALPALGPRRGRPYDGQLEAVRLEPPAPQVWAVLSCQPVCHIQHVPWLTQSLWCVIFDTCHLWHTE